MLKLLLFSFTVSVSISPPIVFDLEKFSYPPPEFPFYYPSVDYSHIFKLEYETEPAESIKFIEVYIRGYGELPEGVNFSRFLYTTEEIPPPYGKDISRWIPVSSSWKKFAVFPCKKKRGEIVVPLKFLFRVEKGDERFNFGKFTLKLQFRINVR